MAKPLAHAVLTNLHALADYLEAGHVTDVPMWVAEELRPALESMAVWMGLDIPEPRRPEQDLEALLDDAAAAVRANVQISATGPHALETLSAGRPVWMTSRESREAARAALSVAFPEVRDVAGP